MQHLKLILLLLLAALPALAQEPAFDWGPAVRYEPRKLQHMQVVGVSDEGFYTTYQEGYQITLERYNNKAQRLWAIAVLPKTPQGQSARFLSAVLLQERLYILSTFSSGGRTSVFAQQISESGNYNRKVQPLSSSTYGSRALLATSPDNRKMLLVQTGESGGPATATLFSHDLEPGWTKEITPDGSVQEIMVRRDGTSFLLAKAGAQASSTAAFQFFRIDPKDGTYSEIVLGNEQYRPLQAHCMITPNRDVVLAGYFVLAGSVVTQNPEPRGAYFYRFPHGDTKDLTRTYSVFNNTFITAYKLAKPDDDDSERLRKLHLGTALATGAGNIILVGEVESEQLMSGSTVQHYDDLIVVRLKPDDKPLTMASVNKEQQSRPDGTELGSYFATLVSDTLHILYLDFQHNYNARGEATKVSSRNAQKTPVLMTMAPGGTMKKHPLRLMAGAEQHFYLRPAATYPVSEKEYIVLGIGDGYYRYGWMRF